MILPFVREIFAELENAPGFERVRRHLSLGAGRRRVSGLTSTARALYLPLMARAAKQPVIVIVADNKAAEALEPLLKAGCELTGAIDPARVVRFPAHDVLPFENLSPHPDVQEQRAAALWKLSTGAIDILIAPIESAALKLFDLEYYAGLAVTLKRSEEVDIEVAHHAPRQRGLHANGSRRDAGAVHASRRNSGRVFARGRPASAHRVLRRRD